MQIIKSYSMQTRHISISINNDYIKVMRLGGILFIIFTIITSCKLSNSEYPKNVTIALKTAGENKKSLEKVIKHYNQNPADSLKLKAAYFLIGNMPGLYTYDAKAGKVYSDIANISPEYLIENIDQAYDICKNKLLTGKLSFNNFCNYVLPYRIGTEKLENWRNLVLKKYQHLYDSIGNYSTSELLMLNHINEDIRKGFKWVNSNSGAADSYSDLSKNKTGDCNAMSKLATFCMRAFGVPVAMDCIPFWGNFNGAGHVWNSFIVNDSIEVPFMGAEANPYEYDLFWKRGKNNQDITKKCAKVFRCTYSLPDINLLGPDCKGTSGYFYEKRLIDVTERYLSAAEISINIQGTFKECQHACICTYSKGQWRPIFWTKISKSNLVKFKDMAVNLVYMVHINSDKRIIPVSNPILLSKEGKSIELIPDTKNPQTVDLQFTGPLVVDFINSYSLGLSGDAFLKYQDELWKGKHRQEIETGKEYALYYWNNRWKLISTTTATGKFVQFKNVPSNSLYKMVDTKSKEKKRIFTYEDGEVKWW